MCVHRSVRSRSTVRHTCAKEHAVRCVRRASCMWTSGASNAMPSDARRMAQHMPSDDVRIRARYIVWRDNALRRCVCVCVCVSVCACGTAQMLHEFQGEYDVLVEVQDKHAAEGIKALMPCHPSTHPPLRHPTRSPARAHCLPSSSLLRWRRTAVRVVRACTCVHTHARAWAYAHGPASSTKASVADR